MVRIGVIGCGKIAEKHLSAYKMLDDVEVTVTDIVPKGEEVSRQFGVGWCDNPDKLITGNAVDVVDVCIPTPSHAQVMIKALDSGKHVFCEKPFTRTLAEAECIAEKAAQVQRSVMVGYPYRFHPAVQLAQKVLADGIIGQPNFALFRIGGRGNHKAWKHLRSTGGGAESEMLVHMLDLILWYLGDVAESQVLYKDILLRERVIEGKPVTPDAPDIFLVQLSTVGGANVICESDLVTPSYMNAIEIHGSNGSLWTSIMEQFPTIIYCKEARGSYQKGNNILSFPHVDFFHRELEYFIKVVQNGEQPKLNTVVDSLKIMRLIEQWQEE